MQEVARVVRPSVAGLAMALAACNSTPGATGTAAGVPSQAACNCVCPSAAPVASGVLPPGMGALSELVSSASRKMFHEDGKGCLADLDQAAAIDPTVAGQQTFLRAQCEMLTGECQKGKTAISAQLQRDQAMSAERAEQVAESIASLRCRGGDSTQRDELLRAYQDLTNGAYIDPKDPAFCRDRLETVIKLAPLVPADGPDDQALAGSRSALFHTAAACFAKAGDCAAARKAYRDHFPAEGIAKLPPAEREKIVTNAFDASLKECAGR